MPKTPLIAEPLSQVHSEMVQWLWKPYLPRGKLILLDGDPKVGKSFLSIDLAARLSRGGPLPDGQGLDRPHVTLILSAEDEAADTILPRAVTAGANLNYIHSIRTPSECPIRFPRNASALAALIAEREADLVVIDPFAAFLQSGSAIGDYQAMRRLFNRLRAVALQSGCAILLIRHLRKAGGEKALYRGLGSVGLIGAVQVGWMAGPFPGHTSLNVLSVSKTNLTSTPPSLGYRLGQDESGRGLIEWTGPIPVTADDLGLVVPKPLWPRQRAADWLLKELASGPRRASEILAAAARAGFPAHARSGQIGRRIEVRTGGASR